MKWAEWLLFLCFIGEKPQAENWSKFPKATKLVIYKLGVACRKMAKDICIIIHMTYEFFMLQSKREFRLLVELRLLSQMTLSEYTQYNHEVLKSRKEGKNSQREM